MVEARAQGHDEQEFPLPVTVVRSTTKRAARVPRVQGTPADAQRVARARAPGVRYGGGRAHACRRAERRGPAAAAARREGALAHWTRYQRRGGGRYGGNLTHLGLRSSMYLCQGSIPLTIGLHWAAPASIVRVLGSKALMCLAGFESPNA